MRNTDFMNLSLPEGADKIDIEILNSDFTAIENLLEQHAIVETMTLNGESVIIGAIGPYIRLQNIDTVQVSIDIGNETYTLASGENAIIRETAENIGIITSGNTHITYFVNPKTYADKTFYTKGKVDELLSNVEANVEVDAELSETSENPVQNKVITQELASYATSLGDHNTLRNKDMPDQHPMHSITGLESALMQLLDNASGVRNLLDDAEWSTGFYNNSNVTSVFKSFCNAIIPVVPGETLYMNYKPKSVNMALFDLSKNFIQNLNVSSDVINIPDNVDIAYISVPITASSLQGAIVSREKISQKGSLTKAIYSATPGEPETITLKTIKDTYIYPNSYLVFTTNDNYTTGVTPEWKATYALQKDGVIGNYTGFIILGYKPETAEFLCVSLAGHMYVFSNKIAGDFKQYADSEFKMIDKLRTMVGQIASANESVSTKTIPLEPVRKITTNSAFIFTKQDGTILQTITFERIDELLNGDYTVEDFTPATGLVYMDNTALYPSGAIFNLSSLTPVTSYSTVDIAYKPENQWQGLLWYAYGTSLTAEGTGKYAKPLAEMTGLTLKNYGKGGSGIIPALHGDDNIKTRCMRLADGKVNADLITIEIIPNDGSGTLGTSTDTSDDTFCGNLNQILEYLQTNCPKSQIVVLIANRGRYKAYDESTQYPPTSENITKRLEWEAMTEEVCKRNCVPCINANDSGLGYYRVTGNNNYIVDQIHMTDLGGYNIAKCFWSKLKNIPTLTTTEGGE